MSYTDILKLIPTMQSTALASDNYKFAMKNKHTMKSMTGQGVKNIVGTSLLQDSAKLIGS